LESPKALKNKFSKEVNTTVELRVGESMKVVNKNGTNLKMQNQCPQNSLKYCTRECEKAFQLV